MALRTNSKKAIENVRKYIMQDSDYICERSGYTIDENNIDQVLSFAYECFEDEMKYAIERNYSNPCFVIFEDWARGLALGGLFCYYYNRSAVDDLGAILEETEEEKAKYTEQEAEECLTMLIYREMEKANFRFTTGSPRAYHLGE